MPGDCKGQTQAFGTRNGTGMIVETKTLRVPTVEGVLYVDKTLRVPTVEGALYVEKH